MGEKQKAGRMGEEVGDSEIGGRLIGTQRARGLADRRKSSRERSVQGLVALAADAFRPHAPAKEVEAEIEVARVLGIEIEEGKGRRRKPCGRFFRLRCGGSDRFGQPRHRCRKHLRIKRFLGIEVEIKRGRRVAGSRRDPPQGRRLQPVRLEDLPRGVEDALALGLGGGLSSRTRWRRHCGACGNRHSNTVKFFS